MNEKYGDQWLPTNKFLTNLQETAIIYYTLAQAKAPITARITESLDEIFVIEMSYPIEEMLLSYEERMSLLNTAARDIEIIAIELLKDSSVKNEKMMTYDEKIELYQKISTLAYNKVIPLYREIMAILAPERNKAFDERRIHPDDFNHFLHTVRHGENASIEEFKIHLKEDHSLRVMLKKLGIDPDSAEDYL